MAGEGKIKKMPFIRVFFNTFEEFLDAYAQYLSKGGMFIKTPVRLKGGEKIKIEMKLKNGQPLLRGIAEVVWEKVEGGKTTGVGVKFIQLTPDSLKFVENVVQKKLKEREQKAEPVLEEEVLSEDKLKDVIEEPDIIEEPEEVVEPEEVIAPPEEESDFLAPPEDVEEIVEEPSPSNPDEEKVVQNVVEEKDEKGDEEVVTDEFSSDEEFISSKRKGSNTLKIIIIFILIFAVGIGAFVLLKPHKEIPVETAKVPDRNIPAEVVPDKKLPEETVEESSPVVPVTGEVSEKAEGKEMGEAGASVTKKDQGSDVVKDREIKAAEKIVDINVKDGISEIILDGKIDRKRVKMVTLRGGGGNYPRVVVKIRIPQRKLDRWVVKGAGKLKRIRLGIHPPEVWLVYDFLTGRNPPRCRLEVEENRIILRWKK